MTAKPEDAVTAQPEDAVTVQPEAQQRLARTMSGREVATVIAVMALFVGTGVGVILRSAEAASVAFAIGLVVAAVAFGYVSARGRAASKEEK